MSCSYAEGLSPYENKGKLGLPESVDKPDEFEKKVKQLVEWIEEAKHVVIHTGAGISTAAGIPDFRGPNGVWTLEKKGIKPKINISFDDAKPTPTHMAILELVNQGKVHYVVSQNIDALHLRSGLSRRYLAELHGNMYVDQCNKCERQFVRTSANKSVGQKNLNIPCPYQGFRPCRGTLHDTILDWEHNLPQKDINLGDYNSSIADLSICLGTTLQINPSGMLPIYTKKYNQGRLVICNLSNTKHDKKADLVIRGYVDDILLALMKRLNFSIPEYDEKLDPSRSQEKPYEVEWTLLPSDVQKVKKKYEQKMRENKGRKMKTELIGRLVEKKDRTKEEKEEEIKMDDVPLKKRKVKNECDNDVEVLDVKVTPEKKLFESFNCSNQDHVELLDQKLTSKGNQSLTKNVSEGDVNDEIKIIDVKVLPKEKKSNLEEIECKGSLLLTNGKHFENIKTQYIIEKKENSVESNETLDRNIKLEDEEHRESGKSLTGNSIEMKENVKSE